MKRKIFSVLLALVLVCSFSLVMAVPASATHTSSATIAFADGASTVAGATDVVLDVTVTNDAASAGDINEVKIDFSASDFTVTGTGDTIAGWTAGGPTADVVTYTAESGSEIAPGASVIFSPVVTNPAEAGDATVPAVLTTDPGSQAELAAAEDTGWIGYVADSVGSGGNDITVEYVDPGFPSQSLSVSVAVKAITVNLATDGVGDCTSTASEVAVVINGDTDAAALVDATADVDYLTYVVQPLTVPAFTGGTSPEVDKDCPVTPAVLTVIGEKPEVLTVSPDEGNVGDTMWVEVTGTGFTGTAATNACTTTLYFGAGITVVSSKFIGTDEIDCQITINATGTPTVVATTAAGTGTVGQTFTAKAEGTKQVDVWDAYTPTDDPFVTGTLVFQETTATIGAAITAATTGDTLIAHAATYPENVVINKSITLESMDGPASTTIDASAKTAEVVRGAVQIMSDGVTLGGDGVGFTIIAPDATTELPGQYGIELFVDGTWSDITIQGNTIRGSTNANSSSPQYGIHFWGTATYSSLTIKDNTFTTTFVTDTTIADGLSCGMIAGGNVNSINGTFDDNSITGYGKGIMLHVLNAATTFSNNTVQSCDYEGIDVGGTGALTISGNTISGNAGAGVDIRTAGASSTVTQNSIHGNGDGVKVRANAGSITIEYNDIYSNTNTSAVLGEAYGPPVAYYMNYGIYNKDSVALDARYNWWGAIGGPSADAEALEAEQSEALGNGDIVSKDVTFDPWLTELQATVITDGIRSYGSDAIALAEGWNTLSVPCGFKGSADTFGDIQAMGDYLDDFVGGYWYDAAVPQWKGISSATTLEPGKGFYIQMSAASSFPVLYFDGGLHLPAYNMSAGWNLIGAMFGIDRTGDDYGVAAIDDADEGEGWMNPLAALNSIQASGSVIISPSVPGQGTNVWATTVSDSTEKMLVGEAYWVFMTADGTLAGFEVTPFYFTWSAP